MRGDERVEIPASVRAPLAALLSSHQESFERFGKTMELLRPRAEQTAAAIKKLATVVAALPALPRPALPDRAVPAMLWWPDQMTEVEEFLLRPRVELPALCELPVPGRPKGPSPQTADMLRELAQRILAASEGAEWTPIASEMLKQRGVTTGVKNKADHLVRTLRNQVQRFK